MHEYKPAYRRDELTCTRTLSWFEFLRPTWASVLLVAGAHLEKKKKIPLTATATAAIACRRNDPPCLPPTHPRSSVVHEGYGTSERYKFTNVASDIPYMYMHACMHSKASIREFITSLVYIHERWNTTSRILSPESQNLSGPCRGVRTQNMVVGDFALAGKIVVVTGGGSGGFIGMRNTYEMPNFLPGNLFLLPRTYISILLRQGSISRSSKPPPSTRARG